MNVVPHLAAYLYRETRQRGYKNETDLVNDILRQWSVSLPALSWPEVAESLKAPTAA
ncbi:hypothetical protein [Gemmata massiliana]|uniref:hypothetical protein n=1 Tax=Gemmata massiliana TaxID=1210884 RepID=UPI0013A6BBD5|nr:hypothetical protein [Gemmata massiliana]